MATEITELKGRSGNAERAEIVVEPVARESTRLDANQEGACCLNAVVGFGGEGRDGFSVVSVSESELISAAKKGPEGH